MISKLAPGFRPTPPRQLFPPKAAYQLPPLLQNGRDVDGLALNDVEETGLRDGDCADDMDPPTEGAQGGEEKVESWGSLRLDRGGCLWDATGATDRKKGTGQRHGWPKYRAASRASAASLGFHPFKADFVS